MASAPRLDCRSACHLRCRRSPPPAPRPRRRRRSLPPAPRPGPHMEVIHHPNYDQERVHAVRARPSRSRAGKILWLAGTTALPVYHDHPHKREQIQQYMTERSRGADPRHDGRHQADARRCRRLASRTWCTCSCSARARGWATSARRSAVINSLLRALQPQADLDQRRGAGARRARAADRNPDVRGRGLVRANPGETALACPGRARGATSRSIPLGVRRQQPALGTGTGDLVRRQVAMTPRHGTCGEGSDHHAIPIVFCWHRSGEGQRRGGGLRRPRRRSCERRRRARAGASGRWSDGSRLCSGFRSSGADTDGSGVIKNNTGERCSPVLVWLQVSGARVVARLERAPPAKNSADKGKHDTHRQQIEPQSKGQSHSPFSWRE